MGTGNDDLRGQVEDIQSMDKYRNTLFASDMQQGTLETEGVSLDRELNLQQGLRGMKQE